MFSRFQTELFAFSPLSTMSYSVVDSFNLLNAIFAFCSSRGSGLVLTQSPQQIAAQLRHSRGPAAGARDPPPPGSSASPRSAAEGTAPAQPPPLATMSARAQGLPAPGQRLPRGRLGSRVRVGVAQGRSGWQSPARAPAACQLQPKRKATVLQKLPLPRPRGWHSPGVLSARG